MLATPTPWLALDIETAGGRPEDAESWMRANWAPSPKWKPETIGARYLEMLGKKTERLALLDASPIISVAIRTPLEFGVWHSMQAAPPSTVQGAFVHGFATEREMLSAFRTFLAGRTNEETLLVGHNILHFDLPRLRQAFLRNGLQLPAVLSADGQPAFDTMREFCRRFSADSDSGMIGLDELLKKIGLPSHKDIASGADVPGLFAAGQFETILRYTLLDVATEADVFLRLTGCSPSLA